MSRAFEKHRISLICNRLDGKARNIARRLDQATTGEQVAANTDDIGYLMNVISHQWIAWSILLLMAVFVGVLIHFSGEYLANRFGPPGPTTYHVFLQ